MDRSPLRVAVVAGLSAVVAVTGLAPASAGSAAGITLQAEPVPVRFGESVTLSGVVDPPDEGPVTIVEVSTSDPVLSPVPSGPNGSFSVTFEPDRNVRLRAEWNGEQSDPLWVRVRPIVRVKLGQLRLFGKAKVTGRVRPAIAGARVEVSLRRGVKTIARRKVPLTAEGRFTARLPVRKPGRLRALAVFDHEDLLRASARSRPRKTPLPSLGQGSRGKVVRLLEQRLRSLGYWLTGINRAFDHRTGDAVLAFHKVQGMARVKSVRPATWRRLASPRRPSPRSTKPAFHVEIDQTKQVLYVIRRGEISEIVHTSSGAGGATRDGVFRVHRKIAGYSPGRLYYPSYFDGLRAVHGWPSVPTYPASHGCSRVPNWTAIHLHNVMPIGTVVRVYH
ncbi:MAG TPA: L,D-transpeptidase family protein [Actinomycetota bacterium]